MISVDCNTNGILIEKLQLQIVMGKKKKWSNDVQKENANYLIIAKHK